MSIFKSLFDEEVTQVSIENEKEILKQNKEEKTLMAQGHFLSISEDYRRKMNKALNFVEKYKIAIELIRELTGDELFYIMHMKDIGAMPQDEKTIKKAMQEAVVIDTKRRVHINSYRYDQEKTLLNEFIYESSLIDLELLAIEKDSFKNTKDYEKALEEKILEKQSLNAVYIESVAKGVDKDVS